jgi:hypothetical protein
MRRALPCLTCCLAALAMLAGPVARAEPAPEPAVQRTVSEDDHVRIEELRVRGQTQRVIVRSKTQGVAPYEILTIEGGRDLSQDKRATGRRVWHILSF